MTSPAVSELIDDAMDVYVEWREECVAVDRAYERWAEVSAPDRELAFAAYREALDREELASSLYAKRTALVAASVDGENRPAAAAAAGDECRPPPAPLHERIRNLPAALVLALGHHGARVSDPEGTR